MSDPEPGLPTYGFTDLLKLAGFASRPMLREDRREPAPDQDPVGQYWSGHAWVVLFKAADAVDMPPLTPGRQRQYDKARTCARCGSTSKVPVGKGRDGERYCSPCQLPAAELLWQREREADRPGIVAWARGVLADPNVVLGAVEQHQYWKSNLVVDLDGVVLFEAEIRHSVHEPYDSHPLREELLRRSPLAVTKQVEALRGRRMIAWDSGAAPTLVALFDDNGWAVELATKLERTDALGPWYDRWVGELRPNGSYLHHPQLAQHWPSRNPRERVARMREILTEMAGG